MDANVCFAYRIIPLALRTALCSWDILKVLTLPLRFTSGIVRLTLQTSLRLFLAWLTISECHYNSTYKIQSKMTFRLFTLFLNFESHYYLIDIERLPRHNRNDRGVRSVSIG